MTGESVWFERKSKEDNLKTFSKTYVTLKTAYLVKVRAIESMFKWLTISILGFMQFWSYYIATWVSRLCRTTRFHCLVVSVSDQLLNQRSKAQILVEAFFFFFLVFLRPRYQDGLKYIFTFLHENQKGDPFSTNDG